MGKTRSTSDAQKHIREPIGPAHYSIACHTLKQGSQSMYLFPMSAKRLWSVVQINQRKEDKEEGYQRALSVSRVNRIAQYLDQGNAIPGAILISFDKAKLNADGNRFIIENEADSGWVIDGQHRLAGAHKAVKDVEVPVVGFLGLPPERQIELFVTINREQKGVPSSLYYDLLKHLPRKLSDEEVIQERANDLVAQLRQDQDSPFFRRIKVTTSPKRGELSSTNVIRKLTPHIKRDGRLASFSDDERVAILNNLYRALEQVFPKEYKRSDTVFFKTVGFGAIMNALPVIIDATARLTGRLTFRVDSVATTLRLLKGFDFDSWRQMGTGNAAESQAGDDLRTRLSEEARAVKDSGIEL